MRKSRVRADNIHCCDTATALPHHLHATSCVLNNPTAKLSTTREEKNKGTAYRPPYPTITRKSIISPQAQLCFTTSSIVFHHKLHCVSPQAPLYFTTSSAVFHHKLQRGQWCCPKDRDSQSDTCLHVTPVFTSHLSSRRHPAVT